MKSVIILCVVAVVALANPVQQKWNRVHQQCQSNPAFYVNDDIFEQLKRGEKPNLPPNFGLHANCMLKKLDLQDEQGHVLQNGVRQAVQRSVSNSNKVNQIVNECSADQDSKEKTALQLFKCLGTHRIDIGQY